LKFFLQKNDFKNMIAQANDFATKFFGGELLIKEQDDIPAFKASPSCLLTRLIEFKH